MCHAVTCSRCEKPGWVGCGQHVEMVVGHVPEEERCHCAPVTIGSRLRRLFAR